MRSELSDATHHLEELTDQLQQAQHQVEKRGGAGGSRELQGKVNQLERALEIEREQRKQVHMAYIVLLYCSLHVVVLVAGLTVHGATV